MLQYQKCCKLWRVCRTVGLLKGVFCRACDVGGLGTWDVLALVFEAADALTESAACVPTHSAHWPWQGNA